MHEIRILELDKSIYIPENMDECDRTQRLDMAKLVLMYQMLEINLDQFKIMALYNLMNMDYSEESLPNLQEEKWQNIYVVAQVLDSFFEMRDDKLHLLFTSIDNPVKKVSYKAHSFIGPSDWFKDMKWGQFLEGIGELQKFSQTGDMECLIRLFAIFYLKKNERFTAIDLAKRVDFFRLLDARYVYHFYLLFNNFWMFLRTSSVIRVDGKEINLTLLFEGGKESEISIDFDLPELGFRSTTYQLAESGVFGSLEKLLETNFGAVILNMYDIMVRAKRREAELEAQKTKS